MSELLIVVPVYGQHHYTHTLVGDLERVRMLRHVAAPVFKDLVPREREVTLADLLDDDGGGYVALNDRVVLTAAELAEIGHGHSFRPQYYGDKMLDRSGLAEQRLAKTLGISGSRLADVSSQLWGSTFSEERDRRAGVGANQQKRGRISRELRAELEKVLADGNN